MVKYLLSRFAQTIAVLFGVTLVVFLLFHLQSPTQLAQAVIGDRATAAQIHAFFEQEGYGRPLWDQYYLEVDHLVHLNFGHSWTFNESVSTLVVQKLPKTLVLVGCATVLALVVAIPLGIFQTVRRNKPADYALTTLTFVFYAMPSFVLGNLLILYLAVAHHIFPPLVPAAPSVGQLLSDPRALVLPIVTLSAITMASFSRYMRSSMMDAMAADFVRTARAKGIRRRRILFVHAFRNAILPIITLIGLAMPSIVGGAVITETVFNFPGMGLLTFDAIQRNDLSVIVAVTVVFAVAAVAGSLIADLLYAVADPRIRYVSD
jgi:peptide/nickel transport system permease protein